MDFCVLVTLLAVGACSLLHVESSPVGGGPRSTEQDIRTLLDRLKNLQEEEEEEEEEKGAQKHLEEEVIDRQDNRRRCSSDTRFTLSHAGQKYEFEMCVDSWIVCLRPNRNIPRACVNEEAGSCGNIIWWVSRAINYTLTVCIEGHEVCLLDSPLKPCMNRNSGLDQQRQKAMTESLVLCHENKDGSEECVNYKDLNSDRMALNQIDPESVCVCMENTAGSRLCSPRACDTFSKP